MLSIVSNSERRLQKAAPKMYPLLTILWIVISWQLEQLAISDLILGDMESQRESWRYLVCAVLLSLALLAFYLGRLIFIHFYHVLMAPFGGLATAAHRTAASALVSIIALEIYVKFLCNYVEHVSHSSNTTIELFAHWLNVQPYIHNIIIYVACLILLVLGGHVIRLKVKQEDEAIGQVENPQVRCNESQSLKKQLFQAPIPEPSVIESGLYMLRRAEKQKLSGSDTVGDMVVRAVLLCVSEVIYAFILITARTTVATLMSPAYEAIDHRIIVLMALFTSSVAISVVMVLTPIQFYKSYMSWKMQRSILLQERLSEVDWSNGLSNDSNKSVIER